MLKSWTSISKHGLLDTYIPISESPNFDIEALYFDCDIGPDIGLRYRSPLTLISKSLISQNFDIQLIRFRYRITSISKLFNIEALRYGPNFEEDHHNFAGIEIQAKLS